MRALPLLIALVLATAAAPRPPSARYDAYFRKYSKRYFGPGFAWRVFKAQAMAESGLDSTAQSRAGAQGLMQLMPATYAAISAKRPDLQSVFDAQSNIAAGILHDAHLWKLFNGIEPHRDRYRFMVGAYNAGEGTILRAQRAARDARLNAAAWTSVASIAPTIPRWRYRETLGYVDRIADNYRWLRELDAVPPIDMNLESH